jgi:hypothetical protein
MLIRRYRNRELRADRRPHHTPRSDYQQWTIAHTNISSLRWNDTLFVSVVLCLRLHDRESGRRSDIIHADCFSVGDHNIFLQSH